LPKQNYLLDACALLAFYDSEEGADVVSELIDSAERGEVTLSMNAANLIEVYYDRVRKLGSDEADDTIRNIYEDSPITIIEENSRAIVREAAYFKATGKMSFADAILAATARCTGATVVTCDHVELEPVERQTQISFLWIRPQF
jgi:predicted nucleic acid-binding protein